MRAGVGALGVMLLAVSAVAAQNPARQYTRPSVPPRELLDPLNLEKGWATYLPVDGFRDGVHSMQIHPDQLIIQMRSGMILALDAATGAPQWRTVVGLPYVAPVGFGSNATSIFVSKGVRLFAIDRKSGQVQWEFPLPNAPTAAPVADNEFLFIPAGTNRLLAYQLPKPGDKPPAPPREEPEPEPAPLPVVRISGGPAFNRPFSALGVGGQTLSAISAVSSRGRRVRSIGPLSSAAQASEVEVYGPQPRYLWEYVTETRPETRLEQASIITDQFVFQAGQNGLFFGLSKIEPRIFYRIQADAPVSAPLGQWGETAYVASEDFRLYAMDIVTGQILWRFVSGGPIVQKPRLTDEHIFVQAEGAGMYCLQRTGERAGDPIWHNPQARRFLAVNKKFVYARDSEGRLLVLDRGRGTTLAALDATRDFVVPMSNETTDRIYLASNDGLLVSLHDRDYPKPLIVKHVPVKEAGNLQDVKPTPGKSKRPAKKSPEKSADEMDKDDSKPADKNQ